MKKSRHLILFLCLLIGVTGCGSNQGADEAAGKNNEDGTHTLKLVSVFPSNHAYTRDVVPMWIDKVESEMENITIDWIGSDETIPVPEQFSAVQTGIADVGFNVAAYFGNEVPEAEFASLSPFTPSEERENEFFNYLSGVYEDAGVVYLGRWLSTFPFYFWSNDEVKTLEDFQGLSIRSNPVYHRSLEALGANPVAVVPSEIYTSLERGMVDGFGFPLLGPREDGWTEVTSYLINEPFFNQQAGIYINPDALSTLPEGSKEKLIDITAEFEKDMVDYFDEEINKEMKAVKEAGVELTTLSEEESREFQEIVYEAKWSELEESMPDAVKEVKEIFNQ
ncbi:TRAP transporter substrate-binding protein DctP [Alteribacillus iranensis]|uniref:TRAP-type C4-dicarboxylate transport system, substrate-binding protein n=1 Tax=Alteribacillus iranensis TaxID=930128 RepID=A0A1I2B7B8_9BACI|nr:TRAP transporter substrate-binding protein DctP [Alteribacillus iranensis]SFE51808.1 TRAP-type C4-dicarboxylate transport system, substrate-binding protein [Alteribacillus iranensis]